MVFVRRSTGPIQTLLNGLMAKADRSAFKNNPKRALENSNGCFKYSDWIFRYDFGRQLLRRQRCEISVSRTGHSKAVNFASTFFLEKVHKNLVSTFDPKDLSKSLFD